MLGFRWIGRVGVAAIALLLAACSSVDIPNKSDPALLRASDIAPSEPLHWIKQQKRGRADLVTLALSGGGVKSATFSSETMFYLQAIGLLRKTSAISSVSGGGYAAARYVLSCDNAADENCVLKDGRRRPVWDYRTTMATMQDSTLLPLVARALPGLVVPFVQPTISGKTYATFLNRTYLQPPGQDADFTFADIDETRRPRLIANATIVSDFRYLNDMAHATHFLRRRNSDEFFHFAFTDYFFKTIGSDLSKLSVSYGIAASGAFPLLIDYVPLANFRRCLRHSPEHREQCARDAKEQLALIDGGANDNQGVVELYALIGELLLRQARSDNSADPEPGTPRTHMTGPAREPERMRPGDKALLVVINSALTEGTGLKSRADSPPWLLGNIQRSTGAVDVYSATEVGLRRRLYTQNQDAVNAGFKQMPGWGYGPVSSVEIGLLTLDRYSEGGPEGSAVWRSGIRLPPGLDCRRPGYDTIACEIYATSVPVQKAAWKKLRPRETRESLMLSPVHPQCLFEESKRADGLFNGLMQLSPHVAVCLRHAARWATALSMQEQCARTGKDSPINDRAALGCDANGVLNPPNIGLMRDARGDDMLAACDLRRNSVDDNRDILTHLAANLTFLNESKAAASKIAALRQVASGLSARELGEQLHAVCDLNQNPPDEP